MQRKQEPVIFAAPDCGMDAIKAFSVFLAAHGGDTDNVVEVACDMSPAFLSGITENLHKAEVKVDWLYIVQTFTKWLEDFRNTLMGLVCLEIRPDSQKYGYQVKKTTVSG